MTERGWKLSWIAQLETDNRIITIQQAESAEECKAVRDELAAVRDELDAFKGWNSLVLREIEQMETRMILERESTKDSLTRILRLNESALSSAVAAIRAGEERSVFFQQITLEFFNSDKNMELIKRQLEKIERLEIELLAKTVESDYFQSELKLVKEHCVSSVRRVDSELADSCFALEISMEACGKEPKSEACSVMEISKEDFQLVHSDDKDITIAMPETESVVGNQEPQVAATVTDEAPDAGGFATEMVTVEEDGEFYMKEIERVAELDGYVIVEKSNADTDELKIKLEAARTEISDLRFILEEVVRRAELAEEAKAALERELRGEISKRQCPPKLRKTPATGATGALGGDARSVLPGGCLTLGKVLNMKYK